LWLINRANYAILEASDSGKGVPVVKSRDEKAILEEMEKLRQELRHILEAHPELLDSPRVYALSTRLDVLISRYMRYKRAYVDEPSEVINI
jgi:hypothetical protein